MCSYVGFPSAESFKHYPQHTFEIYDARVANLVRAPLLLAPRYELRSSGVVQRGSRTEFTCAQRTGQGRGETTWQAEVVDGARGLPAMENGLWDGKSKFTAEMVRAD